MKQEGIVINKKDSELTVEFSRGSACGNCKSCDNKNASFTVKVEGLANIGDIVVVDMPAGQIVKASILAYGLPLIGLIAGIYLGNLLGKSEGFAILGALMGLIVSGGALMLIERKIKNRPQWLPRIIEIKQQQ